MAKNKDKTKYQTPGEDVGFSVLSDAQLNVLKSDYIDAFDEALVILERAQQINPENIIDKQ